jgi:hypothetical protein
MARRQPGMPFDSIGLDFFLRKCNNLNFRKLEEDLVTSYEKLGCSSHSRCISSIHT